MLNGKQHILNENIANPKQVFLIDACGALVTTISLLVILAPLEQYFGMPKKTLYLLSGLAFCLFTYSIICYRLIKLDWKPFLIILIISNVIYSLISIGLIITYSSRITTLGWVYFTLELLVICLIVVLEYKSYLNQKNDKQNPLRLNLNFILLSKK
jgi:hypothetical protein